MIDFVPYSSESLKSVVHDWNQGVGVGDLAPCIDQNATQWVAQLKSPVRSHLPSLFCLGKVTATDPRTALNVGIVGLISSR